MMPGPFDSFFQAGFECSSHRRTDGVRLDLIGATSHGRHVLGDYRQCAGLGFRTLRDGLRWHLIEKEPGRYDWSSWLPMLEAAEQAGVQVIWDLFHYGSPDHVDQASPDFPKRFTDFAVAALEVRESMCGKPPLICPLNEISFICWAVEVGYFPRVGPKQMGWLKRHLVRTAVAACTAIRERWPDATFVWADPLIHIAPRDQSRKELKAAEHARQGQFQAYDWLIGRDEPELGGSEDFVDVVGVNFYPHNQWYLDGPTIPMGHHEHRPLADMLVEVAERYAKPVFISETGAEGSGRAAWLHYVCDEVRAAQERGTHVEGICLYPITAYPGWDNSRHAEVGLLSTIGSNGKRDVYEPLYGELQRQRAIFAAESARNRNSTPLRLAGGQRR
jgi:beta-glucosidase/6-phospho-beta-glucosidase/beta-galactosidase